MATGPKWSRGALDLIDNTYVVRNDLLFEYYPISVFPYKATDAFLKLEISPGVMAAGVAIIDGNAYDVSMRDLLRRRISVKNKRLHASDNVDIGVEKIKKDRSVRKVKDYSNQQGLSELFGDEIGQVADMAWENQVDSLLQTFHSQEGEEFEITGTTQSRSVHEGGAVPNILENT